MFEAVKKLERGSSSGGECVGERSQVSLGLPISQHTGENIHHHDDNDDYGDDYDNDYYDDDDLYIIGAVGQSVTKVMISAMVAGETYI